MKRKVTPRNEIDRVVELFFTKGVADIRRAREHDAALHDAAAQWARDRDDAHANAVGGWG